MALQCPTPCAPPSWAPRAGWRPLPRPSRPRFAFPRPVRRPPAGRRMQPWPPPRPSRRHPQPSCARQLRLAWPWPRQWRPPLRPVARRWLGPLPASRRRPWPRHRQQSPFWLDTPPTPFPGPQSPVPRRLLPPARPRPQVPPLPRPQPSSKRPGPLRGQTPPLVPLGPRRLLSSPPRASRQWPGPRRPSHPYLWPPQCAGAPFCRLLPRWSWRPAQRQRRRHT
mmetsp:Transcript_60255/g.99548  ORF Transcript_60255/g.99548 Transcript_60255/m.99548 type:complete len:223 (+) Transcript_60255:137-805(+)